LNNIKKSAVSRGENISKKTGQMSSKYGEIIKKLISAPGQLRDDQMGVFRELELEVRVARGLANKLRARHLEAYDLQGGHPGDPGVWSG
jgi:hypothetical protein